MGADEQSVATSPESLLRPEQNQVYEAGLASLRYLESESLQHRDMEVPDLKIHTERVKDLRVLTNTLIDDERWLVSGAHLMTRVIQVGENFVGARGFSLTDEVRNMVEGATIVLHRSLQSLSERGPDGLDSDGKKVVLEGLAKLLNSYHAYDIDFAYRYFQSIKDNLADPGLYSARKYIEEFLESTRFESEVAHVYDGELSFNIKGSNQNHSSERCRDLFSEVLARHNIDFPSFLRSSTANNEVYVSSNFSRIRDLDEAEGGSASFLFNKFGLRFFTRYPLELQLAQYRERKVVGRPYILALSGWYENEGLIFGDTLENNHEFWLNLWQQLDGKFPLRIIESDDQRSLFDRFVTLKKLYGREPTVPLGIVSAHGLKDLIALGAGGASGFIRTTDDFGPPGRYIRSFFPTSAFGTLVKSVFLGV